MEQLKRLLVEFV
uniref:Uncharacterized protein n=1 Tax=Rhizophora mucronata TaxID=61149 RepID=A0A2P2NIA0_RHIMU